MAKTESKNTVVILVSTAVLVILAIAFLSSISDQTAINTQKTRVGNEVRNLTALSCYATGQVNISNPSCNLTVTNAPTSWKIEDCPLTSVVLTNSTGTALTLDTDYRLTASRGLVQMLNTTATNSTGIGPTGVLISYTYCGDNYISSSWGRNVLNVNTGLFAVAILIAVVLVVYLLFNRKELED